MQIFDNMEEKLRYPIGMPDIPESIEQHHLDQWIEILEQFPGNTPGTPSTTTPTLRT